MTRRRRRTRRRTGSGHPIDEEDSSGGRFFGTIRRRTRRRRERARAKPPPPEKEPKRSSITPPCRRRRPLRRLPRRRPPAAPAPSQREPSRSDSSAPPGRRRRRPIPPPRRGPRPPSPRGGPRRGPEDLHLRPDLLVLLQLLHEELLVLRRAPPPRAGHLFPRPRRSHPPRRPCAGASASPGPWRGASCASPGSSSSPAKRRELRPRLYFSSSGSTICRLAGRTRARCPRGEVAPEMRPRREDDVVDAGIRNARHLRPRATSRSAVPRAVDRLDVQDDVLHELRAVAHAR